MEIAISFLAGVIIGIIITRILTPKDKSSIVYERYIKDMRDFATAYSELSVQFVNQHLPAAPPANFSRSMVNNKNNDWAEPEEDADRNFDLSGGALNL